MWGHQYDQQTNQLGCMKEEKFIWTTNEGESNCFGLEPNYGCCTANFNQGFPKLALSSFMRFEDGIASCALVPAEVSTTVRGVPVTVALETGYPFRDTLTYKVDAKAGVFFTLRLRIPSCAACATVNGQPAAPGTTVDVTRRWEGESTVTVRLTFETKYVACPDELFTVWRGPLLYALPIGEKWTPVEYERDGVARRFPYCDWHVEPTTAWNYAYAADVSAFVPGEGDFDAPFTPSAPPVWLDAPMVPVAWSRKGNVCAAVPDNREAQGPVEVKRLIPYGCTNLRISETCLITD